MQRCFSVLLLVASAACCVTAVSTSHRLGVSSRSMVTEFDSLVHKYVNAEWKDEYVSLLEVGSQQKTEWPSRGSSAFPRFAESQSLSQSQAQQPESGGDSGGSAAAAPPPMSSGSGSGSSGGAEASLVGACEVCVFVIENKEQHQPYLCRGLKDPNYQKACVETMESLMWWLTNQVYWLNYGCQREMNGAVEWVRPCPAHAVCSWIEQLYTRTPFCPADPYYKKPQ